MTRPRARMRSPEPDLAVGNLPLPTTGPDADKLATIRAEYGDLWAARCEVAELRVHSIFSSASGPFDDRRVVLGGQADDEPINWIGRTLEEVIDAAYRSATEEKRRRRAKIEIVDATADTLTIRDIVGDGIYPSVTNDAENVVAFLHRAGLGSRKLLYYDSSGDLDELVHDGKGGFTGFAPGPGRGA